MPKQAPRPMTLVHSHEIVKLRMFTNLNKRSKGTFPKKMAITIRSSTEPTGNRLPPNPAKEKTIPNTTYHDTSKQSLINFPNMRRVKELQRAMHISRGPPRKPFLPQRPAATLFRQASRTAALKC